MLYPCTRCGTEDGTKLESALIVEARELGVLPLDTPTLTLCSKCKRSVKGRIVTAKKNQGEDYVPYAHLRKLGA